MKITVIDNNIPFRAGLVMFLSQKLNYTVISEFKNGDEFLENKQFENPDIIIIDISLLNTAGMDVAKKITHKYPKLKMIAMTMHTESIFLELLVKSGYKGCVFKQSYYDDLPPAIAKIKSGGLSFPPNLKI